MDSHCLLQACLYFFEGKCEPSFYLDHIVALRSRFVRHTSALINKYTSFLDDMRPWPPSTLATDWPDIVCNIWSTWSTLHNYGGETNDPPPIYQSVLSALRYGGKVFQACRLRIEIRYEYAIPH
jgi:hypothetical protein